MIAQTNQVYEQTAAGRDFPAMPDFRAEHIAAVRRHLNGGRTAAELEQAARWHAPVTGRLTADDVRSIRARRMTGELLASIAIDYGVRADAIGKICRRKSYRWVQ